MDREQAAEGVKCKATGGGMRCIREDGHGLLHYHRSLHTGYEAWWLKAPANATEMAGLAEFTGYRIIEDSFLGGLFPVGVES